MSDRTQATILPYLIAIFVLLVGMVLIFPFERGMATLHQARLAEEQGESLRAAQLYQQAAQRLFWQRKALQLKAAQSAYQAADYPQVIELLSPLHERGLLDHNAELLLAKAYLETANLEAVMALRQEWVQQGAPTEQIDPILLRLFIEQGQPFQTLPILQTLVKAQPANAEWHYRLGLILAAESPEQAIAPLQQAISLDQSYQRRISPLLEQLTQPSSEIALAYLYAGRGLAAIGEWLLAERAFENAVRQRPDFAEAWAYLGLARWRLAPPAETPALEKQVVSEEERRPYLRRTEQPGLAEIRFALQLNPRSQVALAFLTLYWQEQGNAQLALQSARKAFSLYPADLAVRLQLAQALAQSGDLEGGWKVMSEGIKSDSQPISARKALIRYCLQYGYRLQESALPLAKVLTEQTLKDVESLDLLGQVYLGLQEWSMAQQTFERALSIDSTYAPAYLHLGMVHLAQNHPALAAALFQQVIELDPFSPSGEQAKRYLETYLP